MAELSVLCLFDESGAAPSETVQQTSTSVGFRYQAMRFRGDQVSSGMEPALEKSSHVVVLTSLLEQFPAWLWFVCGFCAGRRIPLLFLSTAEGAEAHPVDLPGYPQICFSIEELAGLLEKEKRSWDKHEPARIARNALVDGGYGLTEATFAVCVCEGDIEAVRNFLLLGYSANIRDKKGVPLLNLAVRNNQYHIMRQLLEAGADMNAISQDRGNTALMDACVSGNAELVTHLLASKADPDIQNKTGQSALILTAAEGKTELFSLLLSHGANTELKDALGMTVQKYATLFKRQDLIDLMEQNGKGASNVTQ